MTGQARPPGGRENPQGEAQTITAAQPRTKNRKIKTPAGPTGGYFLPAEGRAPQSRRPGMLINVDMLPAMTLTKPYFQTSIRGPRQPYRQTLERNSRGQTGGRVLTCSRKNNFFAKILPIYAPPGGHRAGKARDRCRPSGKTDRENRAARVVNDGGDRITAGRTGKGLFPKGRQGQILHE